MIAFCELISIQFLFSGFTQIKGYTYGDVLLCFSVVQMSFTFAELFGNGFKTFSGMVRSGAFDRMMLRPCSLILQIMGTNFAVGRIPPLLTAFVTLALGIRHSQIAWNVMTVWTMAAMITGGCYCSWDCSCWRRAFAFLHSGYFADQCIDIRGKIARKVSYRHLWERDSAVLYLCDSIYIDPILSLAVSAGQNARLASGILSFGNYCVFAHLLFRMAVRSKTL